MTSQRSRTGRRVFAAVRAHKPSTFGDLQIAATQCKKNDDLGRTQDMNQYLKQGLYPVNAPLPTPPWRYKLSPDEHELLLEESKTSSLRSLAGRFGVSHETIRHHLTQVSGCTLSHPALIKGRLHALPFSTPFEAISFIPRATD